MDLGVTSKLVANKWGGYYLAEQCQKSAAAGKSVGVSFAELAAAASGVSAEKAAGQSNLSGVSVQDASKVDVYQEYLEQKYGNVSIQDVGKDQSSMDRIGAGTAGTGNVVIAPNILEQMANDPEKAAYYEGKIQNYFNSIPKYAAELSIMGHEIHSSGIVIHSDGTVTHYISGDLKPEERAKIEARIKAETEEKAKRKRRYQQLHQEAAERRRLEMEMVYKRQNFSVEKENVL